MSEKTSWDLSRVAQRADVTEVEALALSAATELSANAVSHICVTADMTSATWNAVGVHTVFVVNGAARVRLWVACAATLTDSSNLATLQLGVSGATQVIIALTNAAGKNGRTIGEGEFWHKPAAGPAYVLTSAVVKDWAFGCSNAICYEVKGEALTGGVLEFHAVWESLRADGSVTVGAGGAP